MKKILLVAALIAAFTTGAYAQTENGFGGQAEVGYGFKLGDNKWSVFQVSLMPGYHFGPYLFAGVGVGLNSYSCSRLTLTTFPIFAHATANLTAGTTWTPFVALKMGYGLGKKTESLLGATTESKGGFYFAPSLGMKYKITDKHAASLALFYDAMTIKETVTIVGHDPVSGTTNNGAIGLRLGYEF